ncbi:MAG: hypothetical protein P8X83_01940 [Nitrosopumilaceae archaeon]
MKSLFENLQNGFDVVSHDSVEVSGPVESERQKNEIIAKSLGIRTDGLTDEQLQKMISDRMGQKKVDDPENQKPN